MADMTPSVIRVKGNTASRRCELILDGNDEHMRLLGWILHVEGRITTHFYRCPIPLLNHTQYRVNFTDQVVQVGFFRNDNLA